MNISGRSAQFFQPGQLFKYGNDPGPDPYVADSHPIDPSTCADCGAAYIDGTWQWGRAAPYSAYTRCPACRRIHDRAAAGHVSIEGRFAREYHEELRLLVDSVETRIKSQHPLQRIMAIEDRPNSLFVTTTDIHLANSIGEALRLAYKGKLEIRYDERLYLLQVRWQRWM